MCKVYEGKVLSSGKILNTVFPHSAFVTWQGIMHGLCMLKKGVIWWVYNGASIGYKELWPKNFS